MPNSTLSVTMANYNDSHYITIALKAICEQSHPPHEVIIVDDGSTDNSVEVIQEFIAQYPFIRLVHNKKNRGVNFSTNRAARLATGKYVYFASANDLVLPGFFEKAIQVLDDFPRAALCFTDISEIDTYGETLIIHRSGFLPDPGYISPKQLSLMCRERADTLFPIHICCPNSILRREFICNDPVFDPELASFSDWFYCQILSYHHGACYVPELLTSIRRTEDCYSKNISLDRDAYQRMYFNMLKLLATPEYKDITPLMIHGRVLRRGDPYAGDFPAIFRALRGIKTIEAWALILYFAEEIIVRGKMRIAGIKTYHYLKNIYDRAFARSFHIYDKLRTIIKKRFVTPS